VIRLQSIPCKANDPSQSAEGSFIGTVAIRRAVESDLDAIIGLRINFERITRDSGSLDEDARRAEIAAVLGPDLASRRLVSWLAEDSGRPVAQAALRLLRGRAGAAQGEILNVYTDAAFRGRGIGASLLACAIAEARAVGLSSVTLQPTEASRRIYERSGFRDQGRSMILEL
jgi:ribosomal protein S18 acetylase RimI-like enzyme